MTLMWHCLCYACTCINTMYTNVSNNLINVIYSLTCVCYSLADTPPQYKTVPRFCTRVLIYWIKNNKQKKCMVKCVRWNCGSIRELKCNCHCWEIHSRVLNVRHTPNDRCGQMVLRRGEPLTTYSIQLAFDCPCVVMLPTSLTTDLSGPHQCLWQTWPI